MTSPAGPNRSSASPGSPAANCSSVVLNTCGVAAHGPSPGCPSAIGLTAGLAASSSTAAW